MDQNTTTIITSIITVLGTLGGAITGVLLSNRHTLKQEEIKLKQEKAKRKTQIIEEVYQTLIKIEDLCVAFAYDVRQSVRSDLDTVGRIKEIRTNLERVKTLIWLYLSKPIVIDFNEHMNIIQNFWNAAGFFYAQKRKRGFLKGSSDTLDHLEENLTEAQTAYEESLRKLQGKLEKLVE